MSWKFLSRKLDWKFLKICWLLWCIHNVISRIILLKIVTNFQFLKVLHVCTHTRLWAKLWLQTLIFSFLKVPEILHSCLHCLSNVICSVIMTENINIVIGCQVIFLYLPIWFSKWLCGENSIIISISHMRSWGTERINNFPQVTNLIRRVLILETVLQTVLTATFYYLNRLHQLLMNGWYLSVMWGSLAINSYYFTPSGRPIHILYW